MSQVHIQKFREAETAPRTFVEDLEAMNEAIRQRAFSLFQSRNSLAGSDLDDWLQAEREVAWAPPAELIEKDHEIKARLALPGFDPDEIDVSATPDALVVQAETCHKHDGKEGDVRFCEFSEKKLFRRIPLPVPIDVDKVSASLDKGVLQVTAPKATRREQKTTAAA